MRSFCVCLLTVFCVATICAQDKSVQQLKSEASQTITKDPKDTVKKDWKTGGFFNLTFNQAALSNWSAGGDNSALSLDANVNLHAFYLKGKEAWDNTLDLAYGFINTTSLGNRKSDDRIDLLSKYGHDIGKNWYLSALFNFRSQFAPGYNYPSNLPPQLTSDLLSPAYTILGLGVNYKPNDQFSVFLSPSTARWVIVQNDSLAYKGAYGVDSGTHVKFQFGAFASISYNKKIGTAAIYTGRLDLFSDYLHNPQDISIYMTNILAVKVTKVLSMSVTLNVIYDNDIKSVNADGTVGGPKPQIQELFGLGLAYKF
jgi:hypothetical protein